MATTEHSPTGQDCTENNFISMNHMVIVLNFLTLVACQNGLDKQCRPRSDCFWRSSLIWDFPIGCSEKHFVNSSHDKQHFIWEQKEKSVQNFRTFYCIHLTVNLLCPIWYLPAWVDLEAGTWKNHKFLGFPSNTGPDPLKTTKLPSQHSMWAIIGLPATRHFNGVSLAGR